MSVKRSTPKLDKALEILGQMSNFTVEPVLSEESQTKCDVLRKTGRDFFKPSLAMQQSATRFINAELSFEPTASAKKLMEAAAQGVRAQIVLRFTYGQDVSVRPLSAKYLAHKAAKGLDRRVGIATKKLIHELATTRWTVRK